MKEPEVFAAGKKLPCSVNGAGRGQSAELWATPPLHQGGAGCILIR